MQPAVAFALASNSREEYCARTRVAIASLRVTNPRYRVIVVCDRDSYESLHAAADPLLLDADDVLAVDCPPGDKAFCSRFIKTTLRSRIAGPFLYLDSDVFVRESLDEIFSLECDIAGAPNHSRDVISEQVWDHEEEMLRSMGWEIGREVYINGGVIYWNDTLAARRFAEEWHRRWMLSSSSQKTVRDQPAFNSALMATAPKVLVLPHRYNAQVFTSPRSAEDAAIWHFYAAARSRIPERYTSLVQSALSDGALDRDKVAGLAAESDPWSFADFRDILGRNATLVDQVYGLQGEMAAVRKREFAVQEELKGELDNTRAALLSSQESEQATRAELSAAKQEIEATVLERDRAKEIHAHVQALHSQLLATRSWRLTRPLRFIDEWVRRLLGRGSSRP